MQTGKKEDRNTFFSQIADDCSFTFAGRQNVPRQPTGCHHAAPSPCTLHPTPYYIYTFQFPATANAGRGQTTAIVKSFRLFRK